MPFKSKQARHLQQVAFKTGNTFGSKSPTLETTTTTTTPTTTTTTTTTTSSSSKPKKPVQRTSKRILSQQEGVRTPTNEYIIANSDCIEELFFDGYTQHKISKPMCKGKLKMIKKEQRIISGSWILSCPVCDFSSSNVTKLYRTLPTGGRPQSTLNVALSHALLNSPIGVTVFREMMLRIGVNPGSEAGLQNLISNKSNDTVIKLAEKNMSAERLKLKRKHPEGISASCDGRYNNRQSSNTPFQAATQAIFSVTENNTPAKKVIMIDCENKLCSKRTSGKEHICQEHCSTTMKFEDPIGLEQRPASKCAKQLKTEDLKLKSVTNDTDSPVFPAFKECSPEVVHFKDPRHTSNCFRKHIISAAFSKTMFPGTKAIHTRRQKWFAEDLRQRCEAEITSAINKSKELDDLSFETVQTLLKNTPEAIVQCYQGNCNLCDAHSLICSETKRWPKMFCRRLPTKTKLVMNPEDVHTLDKLIDFRLGEKALRSTYTGTNTQKNEALNRSFSKFCPKTVTLSKTFPGRAHAAVLNVNAGFDGATQELLKAAGHQVSDSVKTQIKRHDERKQYFKSYHQTQKYKNSRISRRSQLYRMHEMKYKDDEEPDLGYAKDSDVHELADKSTIQGQQDQLLSAQAGPS